MFFKKSFWSSKNIIFIIFVIAMLFLLPKTVSILLLFFGAYVIACALNPYVNKLQKKMNRTLASALVMCISLICILALIIPVIAVAINEISHFAMTLPTKLTEISDFIINGQIYGHRIQEIMDKNFITSGSSNLAQGILSNSLNATLAITQIIIVIIAMTMIVYYIVLDKDYLKKKTIEFFPPNIKQKVENIISTISFKVGSYARAQLISMAAVGIMVMFVLMILRVDYATLLGLISGVLDIIPILGPTIALFIIILVAYPMSLTKILLIVGGFLLCQQLSNYVIKPFLFGKMMQLHPLTIFLALFLATQFLGFWGVILSPAIAATICVLIDEIYLKPMNVKGSDTDE